MRATFVSRKHNIQELDNGVWKGGDPETDGGDICPLTLR